MSTQVPVRSGIPPEGARDQRDAWLSLLPYPLSFAAASAVGEGIANLLGFGSQKEELEGWYVIAVAGIPALLIFTVPCLLAWKLTSDGS